MGCPTTHSRTRKTNYRIHDNIIWEICRARRAEQLFPSRFFAPAAVRRDKRKIRFLVDSLTFSKQLNR